jgi:hypothetical protein
MQKSPDIILAIKGLIEPIVAAGGYKASIHKDNTRTYIYIDQIITEDYIPRYSLSINIDSDRLVIMRYDLQTQSVDFVVAYSVTTCYISLHDPDLLPELVKAITTLIKNHDYIPRCSI